jgi:hypothetical protein
MYDLLTAVGDRDLTADIREIVQTAVNEKAGDLWTMFKRSDRRPVNVELVQLKILDMFEGYRMIIHSDDLHYKSLNFNRHLTTGQSTAYPKAGSELAEAFQTVSELDLDEVALDLSENGITRRLNDENLRDLVSTITVPTPDHMKDMESKFVRKGGSSTMASCIFHTVPVPGVTSTEKEPVVRPENSRRIVLFHSFVVEGTRLAERNKDYQYTPAILCDMVHGKKSPQSAESIKIWKDKHDIDQSEFYV